MEFIIASPKSFLQADFKNTHQMTFGDSNDDVSDSNRIQKLDVNEIRIWMCDTKLNETKKLRFTDI